jgi:GNAT superfamily N-acetyltransferase
MNRQTMPDQPGADQMPAIPIGIIRRANLHEAPVLHALTGRSVLHWGYEPEFLDWEPEAIAVTEDFIRNATVHVLEEEGQITGYYALTGMLPELELDKLFVEPAWIGTGRGKHLWHHAVQTAREMGATALTLHADPNAAPFYRAMGATWLLEVETSRPGWNLQVFRMTIG